MGRRGGVGIGTVIWILIGAFVAGVNGYFRDIDGILDILSALLAILLWPLLLIGIDLDIRR